MPGEFRLSPESERTLQRTMLQRQDRFVQAQAQVDEPMVERLAWANEYAPTASSELKQAFAATPMSAEQLTQLAQQESVTTNTHAGFAGKVGEIVNGLGMGAYNQVVKPVIRGATTLFEGVAEEVVQRPLTAVMESMRRRNSEDPISPRQAYDEYGDSALLNLAQGDTPAVDPETGHQVEGGVLGHGFFPAGQAGAETTRERRLQINGQPASVGRATSAGLYGRGGPVHSLTGRQYTPGDAAYDVTSGISQLATDVALDPAAWATGGASRAIGAARGLPFQARTLGQAVRGISPSRANDLAEMARTTGAINGSRRTTALAPRVERLIRNREVLDKIADADAYTVFRQMRGDRLGIGRNSDQMADLVGRLGATSDRNEVAEILLESVQRGWIRETGFYSGAGRFTPDVKGWARSVRIADDLPETRHGITSVNPAKVVSPSNRMQSAIDIDAMLRVSKVGEGERSRIFQQAIAANGPDEMMGVVDESARVLARKMLDVGTEGEDVVRTLGAAREGAVWDEMLQAGYGTDDIDEILTAHRRMVDKQRSYVLDQAGNPSPPPWAQLDEVTIDGVDELVSPPKASLLVHLNRQAIPLFDAKDLRRATQKHSGLRKVYQSTGWDMGTAAAKAGTKYLFKFPTLFTRLAYPLRNNLDNLARAAGAGYSSLFNDPLAWASMGIRNPHRFQEVVRSADGALTKGRGFATYDGRYGRVDEVLDEGTENARVRATVTRHHGGDGKPTKETIEAPLAEFREQEVSSVSRSFREAATESGHLTNSASGMWQDRATMMTGNHRVYQKGVDQSFVRAWREQLGKFASDDVARRVADNATYATKDELVDSLINDGVIDEFARFAGDDAENFFFPRGGSPRSTSSDFQARLEEVRDLYPPDTASVRGIGRSEEVSLPDSVMEGLASLPPVRQGSKRLYRSDVPEDIDPGDFVDLTPPGADRSGSRGRWFTDDPRLAWFYRRSGQGDEPLSYVDVPEELPGSPDAARAGGIPHDEFLLSSDDAARARPLPEPGSSPARSVDAAAPAPDRNAVSQYVDWTEGHIDNLTGGNQGLRHTIATGDLNGVDFNDLTQNKRINQILREQYHDSAPRHVSGSDLIANPMSKSRQQFKDGMDWWVDFLASRPENYFTRHPLMAQIYGDDLAHLMPSLADDSMRADLVRRAADAGFDGRGFRHIAQAAQDAAGQNGIVDNMEDALEAAHTHAGDRMLDVAFDATRRSSFQEMADVAFPFYDAFVEVAQSWGKILRDNPNAFIRGSAAYDSLRTSGQFYVNEHGSEVFQYPGGGLVAKALGLDRAQPGFEANVSGLNLVVQGFGPGFGPVVQWAAGAFMPDNPDLQWARDIMFPFGTSVDEPGDLLQPDLLAKELTPAWASKSINAFTEGDWDEAAYNSAVGDALKAIATTRPHDPSDPEQVDQLVSDASSAARWTMFIRSALQMGMPTGPSVEWDVTSDQTGDTHRVSVLANEFYTMLEESDGDYQATNEAFIEMYGHEPFWIAQGKTRELIPGPRTREGYNWIASHPEAAERHKEVVGYFVPAEDPEALPDYSVYQQRLESGEIDSLTGEQQYALANKTKARQIYYAQRDRIESDENLSHTQRQSMLRTVRSWLTDQFPGWNTDSITGLGSRIERDRQIELLEEAVDDPELADSPMTEPLSIYLTKRREAEAVLAQREEAGGPSTLEADANSDLREWLYRIGGEMSSRSTEFQSIWQTLLASEVDDS